MESETQLVLGNNSYKEKIIRYFPGLYIFFILGPARTQINLIIQCLGIAASLLSLVKGVAEFHLFTMFNMFKARKEVNLVSLLKSSLFFFPHILFRSFSISAIAAFTGFYALIPFSLILMINTILTFVYSYDHHPRQIISLFTSFLAPSVFPIFSSGRALLKRSALVNTSILLLSLTAIALHPSITTKSALLATPGLCHLNFNETLLPLSSCPADFEYSNFTTKGIQMNNTLMGISNTTGS